MKTNTRTASEVRALIVTLLAIKRAAVPAKALWIEQRIDVAMGELLKRRVASAYVTAFAAVRDAT